MDEPLSLLVIDDDLVDRLAIKRALASSSIAAEVREASSRRAGLELARQEAFDAVLLDFQLPDGDGLQVLADLREAGVRVPVLMLTGQDDLQVVAELMQAGACDYLPKATLDPAQLARRLSRAVKLHRAQEETRAAQAALAERMAVDELLLGVVSHDLRNPLNAVLMATRLLEREGLPGSAQTSTARIRRATERALRLISDLLDFSQARIGGGLPVVREPVDLAAVLGQVVEELSLVHPARTLEVQEDGEMSLSGDRGRLAQLLGNLVSNALQHSPPDSVVRVRLTAGEGRLRVTLHNDGPPIPPEVLPHLFEPLRRGPQAGASRGSVGLGLFISDQIARAHGGSLTAHSAEGRGTEFILDLPRGA